jgi:cephalosporin hydroxylase
MPDIAARFSLADKTLLGYLPVYQRMAEQIGPAGKVLEVGVRGGESLRLWQALFPEGLVAGVDNDTEGPAVWPAGTVSIAAGQDDPEMAKQARQASPGGYDLIVDDASHQGPLSQATFALLWPLVKPGGWYVVEDWWLGYLPWAAGQYGDSMLRLAESFLPMLGGPPAEDRFPSGIDVLEYRPGQAIIHKYGG